MDTLYDCEQQHVTDWTTLKASVKSDLAAYLFRRLKRSPMILPVINEV